MTGACCCIIIGHRKQWSQLKKPLASLVQPIAAAVLLQEKNTLPVVGLVRQRVPRANVRNKRAAPAPPQSSPNAHGARSARPTDSKQSTYTVWRLTRDPTAEEETVRPAPTPSDTSRGFRSVGWRLLVCTAYSLYLRASPWWWCEEEWVAWLRVLRDHLFCSGPARPAGPTRGLELTTHNTCLWVHDRSTVLVIVRSIITAVSRNVRAGLS
jgi:hypothetical protein